MEKGLPVHPPSEFYRSRSHSPCVVKGQISVGSNVVAVDSTASSATIGAPLATEPFLKGLSRGKKGSQSYDDILDAIGDRQLLAEHAASKIQAGVRYL